MISKHRGAKGSSFPSFLWSREGRVVGSAGPRAGGEIGEDPGPCCQDRNPPYISNIITVSPQLKIGVLFIGH